MGIYDRDYMRRDPPRGDAPVGGSREQRLTQALTGLYHWLARRWRLLVAAFVLLLLAALLAPT